MIWIENEDGTEAHSAPPRFYVSLISEGFVCLDNGARPVEMSEPMPTMHDACMWADRRFSRRSVA